MRLLCVLHRHLRPRDWLPNIDFAFIDEAHIVRKKTIETLQDIDVPVIGLTATPLTATMAGYYSRVVTAVTTNQLINDGWLAPLKVYAAQEIDMTGAATNTSGEWLDSEVQERGRKIIGDIVSEWKAKTYKEFGQVSR